MGVMTTKFLGKFGEIVFILRNAFVYRGLRKFLGDCYTLSPYIIIRMYPITPRRGNEPSAQGSALGERMFKPRPERAKATVGSKAYALSGR